MPPKSGPRSLRIHQSIARQLGVAILSGEYQPGDTIPRASEHAATLKVSRTPYREALQILTAKGLLESRPKAGTQVTPRERWNLLDPDVLAWMFTGIPDEIFIRDLFELRNLLEPAAARWAAGRRTPEQQERMQDAIEGMRQHGLGTPEGQAADQRFHAAILEAAGNLALATLASSVGAAVRWTTHYKQRASKQPRDPLPDHEAVNDAIAEGDSERAGAAMQELLRLALQDMATAL